MDKSGAEAYVYAKACGKIGKSFVEDRVGTLFQARTLNELWTLLFNSQPPFIPEILLAQEIEKEAFKTFIKTYSDFIYNFDKPENILTHQLIIYEAENLKEIGAVLANNEKSLPDLIDIGKFKTLHENKFPDIKQITDGTIFSWYDKVPGIHEQQQLEFKIDTQVTNFMWNSLQKVTGESKAVLIDMYTQEYALKNIIWALRLKINYGMSNEQIMEKLIRVSEIKDINDDPFAAPVVKILEKRIDTYEDWENWKYVHLLNPYEKGNVWKINPAWIEKCARVEINKQAIHVFHQYPMTTAALIAWFKIKDFEMSCIRTAVERLRLNISTEDAMKAIGI